MRRLLLALIAVAAVTALGCASKEKTGMKIYVQQELYDKAILQGAEALEQNPNDGDTHYFLGAAYYGKDNKLQADAPSYADSSELFVTRAYEHFSKAKELADASWGPPADEAIRAMHGRHYNLGVQANRQGDNVTAATQFRLSILAEPDNWEGYYARAGVVWPLAQEAKSAGEDEQFDQYAQTVLADLDKVIELGTPDQEKTIAVFQTKGDVLYTLNRHEEAQAAYKRAVALSPENYTLMLTMANRFYNEQDWENAVNYYMDALNVKSRLNLIDKDDAENYAALGQSLSLLERRDDALQYFEKVLELKPGDDKALYNMMVTHFKAGEAAEKSGDTQTATQHYSQTIELGNQLIAMDAKNPLYWQVRGLAKRGIGDTAGAVRDLTEYRNLRGSGGQ